MKPTKVRLNLSVMRTDVFILLLFFFAIVRGGGPVKESKQLKGYDRSDQGYPNRLSRCNVYQGQRNCLHLSGGWHFNRFYGLCFMNDLTHCGAGLNHFTSCNACMTHCSVSVCAEKIFPADSWEPPAILGGI
uniref:Der and 72 secreted protein n=1 Tax=Rhipicephalus zambeziensis TaxID=60191 RepID=A0A224Y8Y5_9ACAR